MDTDAEREKITKEIQELERILEPDALDLSLELSDSSLDLDSDAGKVPSAPPALGVPPDTMHCGPPTRRGTGPYLLLAAASPPGALPRGWPCMGAPCIEGLYPHYWSHALCLCPTDDPSSKDSAEDAAEAPSSVSTHPQ